MPIDDAERLMWARACAMLEQAERLHRQFFHVGRRRAAPPTWEPPLDMYEISDDEVLIVVALPGVPAEAVETAVEDDTLIVTAGRSLPAEGRGARVHRLEIPHGRFERRLRLPSGRYEVTRKRMRDGCLLLGLRRLG